MYSNTPHLSKARAKMVGSGGRFEEIVAMTLKSSVESYALVNRCFMSYEVGRPIETDVIFVTKNKVYCIECKNYRHSISGKKFGKSWNFISSKKGVVQNPYLLNKKRIRMIRALFIKHNMDMPIIENYIVIPNSCVNYTDCPNVYTLNGLVSKIHYESFDSNPSIDKSSICKFLLDNSSLRKS